jgi:hypothetical protein
MYVRMYVCACGHFIAAEREISSTVQYSTMQYSTVQCSTVQDSAVQCSAVRYSTVQYSTVCSRHFFALIVFALLILLCFPNCRKLACHCKNKIRYKK